MKFLFDGSTSVKRKKRVLLIEPAYRNKYPPLGLMKIATAHLLLGDEVVFCKGNIPKIRDQQWDIVYITSLFTFQWNTTVKTIKFYSKGNTKVIVGGIMASLMPEELELETGIKPYSGPLNGSLPGLMNAIKSDKYFKFLINCFQSRGIDALPPNYGIFDGHDVPYSSILENCYVLRTSRGCKRHCDFCGVRNLEPEFIDRIHLTPVISFIVRNWGEKQNLLLLDDNILMSPNFESIIDEIRDLGFGSGSRFNRRIRWVDYNQGLDIRILSKEHLKYFSTITLKPLRLAFDDCRLSKLYEKKIMWALDHGFKEISSYILYNYKDTPAELYKRLMIASKINERYGCRIYSFPMKYIPCNAMNRHHVGTHWTRRQIRGVQCILNATHGIAPTRPSFLRRAFGKNVEEFLRIIQMPENYIVYRSKYLSNGSIDSWTKHFKSLSSSERHEALFLISGGKNTLPKYNGNTKIQDFLSHYNHENLK